MLNTDSIVNKRIKVFVYIPENNGSGFLNGSGFVVFAYTFLTTSDLFKFRFFGKIWFLFCDSSWSLLVFLQASRVRNQKLIFFFLNLNVLLVLK